VWNNKGYAPANLGEYEEALRCSDKAIELNPNLVHGWNSKGFALNRLGKYKEAIECYDRAIEIGPNHA
jgi:tetratricopeptide (TPR) repeat protein